MPTTGSMPIVYVFGRPVFFPGEIWISPTICVNVII